MSQKTSTLSYTDKFVTLKQVMGQSGALWLQSWSRQLPEFQRTAVKEREEEYLRRLQGKGSPCLVKEALNVSGSLISCGELSYLTLSSPCSLWLAGVPVANLSVENKLSLAIAMTQAVGLLHSEGVFHFSLRPSCFLINDSLDYAEVIGLSEAKLCSRQSQGVTSFVPSFADPYFLSPEQIYLHDRLLDNRSDLYSLGCILYWLFSGEAPFKELKQTSEVNYAHMSKGVTLPSLEWPNASQEAAFGLLLAKLLEKEPEERYQSSAGIIADLRAIQALEVDGKFICGAMDICDRMVIPQRLYGREQELAMLMSVYQGVASGSSQALLIGGYSGVGKSALVDEVRIPIMQADGLFIFGKFEQYQRETPYSAISQAFNRFIDIVLSYEESEVLGWKERLLKALGTHAQVVIDIIPSLSHLLGPVPTPQVLGADEQQNRFNKTFLAFIRQICTVHKPLVLFIDDLQWADSASINLLKLILSDKTSQYCLIIGAYRDNEVDERHPFIRMLASVEQTQSKISQVKLRSLAPEVITQIVADTVKRPIGEVRGLSRLIYEKTAGNPFFFKQFMLELYRTELLSFQHESGCWFWSIEKIEEQSITDNVVDLVTRQLERLSRQSEILLQQAACIGSVFDVELLQRIDTIASEDISLMLKECLDAGLIRALVEQSSFPNSVSQQYKFTHDRVQQAAYARNSEQQRQRVHFHIGRLLLAQTPKDEMAENSFELVAHLNLAKPMLSPLMMAQVMVLNYQAALKAKAATAYETAVVYLNSVFDYNETVSLFDEELGPELAPILQYLEDSSRGTQTSLAAIEKLECLYLAGEYDQAEAYKSDVFPLCTSLALKIKLAVILITQYTRYGQLQRAIDEGLAALSLLSWSLPESPTLEDIGAAIGESQQALSQLGFSEIAKLDDIESQKVLLTLDVLMAMQPCCYNSGSLLFPLTILSLFKLTVEHGNSPYSSYVFMMYALLSTKALKAYPLAFEAAQYSKVIAQRYPSNPVLEGRLLMMNSNFVLPWQAKLQQSHEMRNQAYHLCLENGDYYWGVHAYIFGFYADLISAPSIAHLLERSRNVVSTCELIKQPAQTYLSTLQCNFLEILQGSLDNLDNLDHRKGYEAQALKHFVDNHYMCGSYDRLLARLLQGYLFNRYQQALSISLAEDLTPEQLDEGIFHEAVYTLFNLLCILALKQTAPDKVCSHHEAWFGAAWEKYLLWYQINPDNFEAGFHLISAEKAAVENDEVNALCHYEKAIISASKAGFALYQALASERCGRYRLRLEQTAIATGYLKQAQAVYRSWGAHAKAMELEQTLNRINDNVALLDNYQPNWESIVSASQDISSPLSRNDLINRMLQRAATTTGAQHVGLYLKQDNFWCLSALCQRGTVKEVLVQPESIPTSILNYCLNSRNTLVLKDACMEGEFVVDDYICDNKIRSVLCIPLLVRNEVVGVLYLEHNEASHLFTAQRCQVMELLTNQFAITYKNADFFKQLELQNEALEEAVAHRTEDLNRQNQHLESILHALPIPYVLTQPDGQLVRANELFYECFEVSKQEFEQSTVLSFYQYAEDRERMFVQLNKDGVVNDFECEMKTYAGKPFWAQFSVTRVDLESGPGIFAAIKDISGRKHKEQLLEHQASTDPLTGAYNRRGFEQLAKGIKDNNRVKDLCVVMLDLDKFKILNDTYGHAAGDEVLKKFSKNIQSHLRDQDIFGRVGGEEFAIVLSGLTIEKAEKAMTRICVLTAQTPIVWQSKQIEFTVSIGIAAWARNESLGDVTKRADKALYRAKMAGRNCVKLA